MTAKIIKFGRYKRKDYSQEVPPDIREAITKLLLEGAVSAEDGFISDLAVAYVTKTGKMQSAWITPENPGRLLKSLAELKCRIIKSLENDESG